MSSSFYAMATPEVKEDKVVGIKLDVSPAILPRDTSIGTKIFMLVPDEARNVREVKSYIGNFVLKTPTPFQIFMGEYRIREEEDVKIFSIITEPCRLMPVPVPRSALSSTPKPKTSDKRVTFFDGDLSASPVQGSAANSLDVIDHSQLGRSIHSPHQVLGVASTVRMLSKKSDNQMEEEGELSDSSSERKKRRRRRHRPRKSKSSETNEDDLEENEQNGSEASVAILKSPESSQESQSSNVSKSQLDILNEETESEEETTGGNSKEFDFITPVTNKLPRKRIDISEAPSGIKKKKLSDSAFDSSCSFTSPVASDDSRLSSGKARQDTPIVPRSVKNPRMFESARKIIDVFSSEPRNDKNGVDANKSSASVEMKISPQAMSEQSYAYLQTIGCAAELSVGDHIAFKILELDDRYNPAFSAYKEGIVVEKTGMKLGISYTKNNKVTRTGKYDLSDEDSKEDATLETAELHFSELVEPKFVTKGGINPSGASNLIADTSNVQENPSSPPSNVI